MFVAFVDSAHERDEETDRYYAMVHVRVEGIGRPDAAALADGIEQYAQKFTERATNRGGTSGRSS